MRALRAWSTEDTVLQYTPALPPTPPPNYQNKIKNLPSIKSRVSLLLCVCMLYNVKIVHIVVIRRTIYCIADNMKVWVDWPLYYITFLSDRQYPVCVTILSRENWMIYKGPGFLAVVGFGSSPTPLPALFPVSKLDRRHTGRHWKRDNLRTGEGGRGWRRSQIRRWRESLFLYKSFKTLWCETYNSLYKLYRRIPLLDLLAQNPL